MDQQMPPGYEGYALGGKIMLGSILFLFIVVVLIAAVHLYSRWYFLRLRRLRLEQRRRRSASGGGNNIVIFVENNHRAANRGLEKEVLDSLPYYAYCSKTADASAAECAVCLAEFDENDVIRLLPKCNHSFHIECIDTWFGSHSTCPLCRSPVEQPADPPAVVVEIPEEIVVPPAQASESESNHEPREEANTTSSSRSARKGGRGIGESLGLRIDVGRPIETGGPSQSSPGSPFLYITRFLSMNKRSASPATVAGAIDPDVDGGRIHDFRTPK